jgi:hypothetical protein
MSQDYTLQAKLAQKGKQNSAVKLSELKAKFIAFHEAHGPGAILDRADWQEYVSLLETLMYDDHFVMYDVEREMWMAERSAGEAPWVEIDPEYFDFTNGD